MNTPKLRPEQVESFPVAHLSFSAIRTYLTDRQSFFKRYIRLEFDFKTSASMLEGSVYHKALESLWNQRKAGGELDEKFWSFLNDVAHREIIQAAESGKIEFGKTGSPDKSLKIVEQALKFYRAEMPEYFPTHIEARVTVQCADLNGEVLPVPIKAVYDLLSEREDEIDIVDHKLVTTFGDDDDGSPAFELQAAACFFTAWAQFGKKPARMIFDQVKKSKNMDKSPQRRPFILDFFDLNGNPHPCLPRFLEIYRRIVMELSGFPIVDENGLPRFLPNPFDQLGGRESWQDFCKEVEGGEPLTKEQIAVLKSKTADIEAALLD